MPTEFEARFSELTDEARLALSGRLDAKTVAEAWPGLMEQVSALRQPRLVVDAGDLEYCDGFGLALLLQIRKAAASARMELVIRGLSQDQEAILSGLKAEAYPQSFARTVPVSFVERVGQGFRELLQDLLGFVGFLGELTRALAYSLRHPRSVRWKDALRTAESAGVDALPVVLLVGFLIGLVIAFQAAIPMRQFGADIFIPGLVGIAMVRELGPIMTAVALAGRSGAAFAAELGTMKINEEINALETLGLRPVQFLIVPRVIAAVLMTPLLTVFANLAGILGALVVFSTLGYPVTVFRDQLVMMTGSGDLIGGLVKSFFFGIIVAGVGCLRGLQTTTGASAVGRSTTSSVVTSIVLITIGDGIFSVVYYYLGV